MAESVQAGLIQAASVALEAPLQRGPNGVQYAAFGDTNLAPADLARMVQAVPANIASALGRKAYYFVPLAMSDANVDPSDANVDPSDANVDPSDANTDLRDAEVDPSNANIESSNAKVESAAEAAIALVPSPSSSSEPTATLPNAKPQNSSATATMVAPVFSAELAELAICHRNVGLGDMDGVFISTRLLSDRFALAFEFFINVGHAFVDTTGVPAAFTELAWSQAVADVRGETSQDAWESRALALPVGARTNVDEKAKTNYVESAFSDAVAIYLLSLSVDFDYSELREREYPLLAPRSLAERLRLVANLFPPNPTYEFAIRYRRRA